MRQKGVPTRFPGVFRVDERSYRVRAKARDPRTGLIREIDRMIEAKSAKEAAEIRNRLIAEIEHPVQLAKRERLRDYATSWLRSKLPGLKAATKAHYVEVLGNHILPELGDYYLDAITSADVAKWRDSLAGKPATINSRLRVLKTLLRDAVHDKDLPRDPTSRVAAVRQVRAEDDPNCLTADELRRFLTAAAELTLRAYPLFCTLAFTGGRFGEVTALKWTDIDEETGAIRIRRAQWKGRIDDTKTGAARTLPLHHGLLAILREHRRALVAEQHPGLAAGWVFPGRGGKLLHNTTLRAPMHKCLKAAGITHRFSVHGFRRTFNNLLRQVTQDKVVVRSMTGHATEEMTEHYSHVALDEKKAAVAQLVRLVPTLCSGDEVESGDRGGDAPPAKTGDAV